MTGPRLSIIPAAAATDTTLDAFAYRLLGIIAAYANKSGKCWPSVTSLAADMGRSERRVQTLLKELERTPYLTVTRRHSRTSLYQIHLDQPRSGASPRSPTSLDPEASRREPRSSASPNKTLLTSSSKAPTHTREFPVTTPDSDSSAPTHSGEETTKTGDTKKIEVAVSMAKIWNDSFRGTAVPQVRLAALRVPRKKKLQALLGEMFDGDLEKWRGFCQRIRTSAFLVGNTSSGFKATIDWATKPDNAVKILEGNYTDNPGAPTTRSGGQRQSPHRSLFAGAARAAERFQTTKDLP